MKTTIALAALIAGGAGWGTSARAAAPDRGDSMQSWEDYRIQARQDLDVIEDKIAKLERDAKAAGAEARARLQAETESLRAKKSDADRMLEQFETATDAARKELRMKLDRELRDLKRSIRKAEAGPRDRT